MLSSRSSSKTIKSLVTLTTFTLFSAPFFAQAEECRMDADCAEGEYCEMMNAPSVSCFIDEEGNEDCGEPFEEEELVGFCEERPIECETDSDCPSHLSCGWVHEGGVEPIETEPVDASGGGVPRESDAEDSFPPEDIDEPSSDEPPINEPVEPNEDESMMCLFIPTECESDDECAMNFHCETFTSGVSCGDFGGRAPCEEGEECPPQPEPDCEDEEFTESYCVPDEIDCNSDEMCPEDWRCQEFVQSDCDDSDLFTSAHTMDSEDHSSSEPEPPTEENVERMPEQAECAETVRSLCVPVGLSEPSYDVIVGEVEPNMSGEQREEEGQDLIGEENGESGTPTDAPEEGSSDDSVEDSGGCDAHQTAPTAWALLALLGSLGFRRRYI